MTLINRGRRYLSLDRSRVAGAGPMLAAACLLLIGSASTARADQVLPVVDCNSQQLADGVIYWTSSFATESYAFEETSRTGVIAHGNGEIAQVTVHWLVDPPAPSTGAGFGLRGAGFTPGGVAGGFPAGTLDDFPAFGSVDCFEGGEPEGAFTVFVQFNSLHWPPRRSNIAKGTPTSGWK